MADRPLLALPGGTVTFLLTDVEASTRLWQERPGEMGPAIERHYEILDAAIASAGGVRPVEQGEGDSVVGAFSQAGDAIRAALDAQVVLSAELPWLKVRMAIHTGVAQFRDQGNYVGRSIIRCARLRSCAHGGQVLVSETAAPLLADALPDDASLVDLGVSRLRDLNRSEQVWQLSRPALSAVFPALRSLDSVPHNLPRPLTSFIGRDAERVIVSDLVHRNRLVTLTGAGGCGKTRLALETAADAVGSCPGGTWWVELAQAAMPEHVVDAIAKVVGVALTAGTDPLHQLVLVLEHAQPTMVVLDNAEHLLDEVSRVVHALAASCPTARIVVTSREPLGVPGEVIWRVPSLQAPARSSAASLEVLAELDAVRLFMDRATAARPNLRLDEASAPHVAAICARLDGIPLALELAAARVRSMPLARIADGLDDAFRLLTGASRTVLARQQTLLASIEWSHDLLDDAERAVLRRAAIFVAPFTLDAAEVVAGDGEGVEQWRVLDLLSRLVDKSLVQLDEVSGRYSLLETVRQFCLDRLRQHRELDPTRRRHASWYADWADAVDAGHHGYDTDVFLPDAADALAAQRWAMDHDQQLAFRLIVGLRWIRWSFGALPDIKEQCRWIEDNGVESASEHRQLWARATLATGTIGEMVGWGGAVVAEAYAELRNDDHAAIFFDQRTSAFMSAFASSAVLTQVYERARAVGCWWASIRIAGYLTLVTASLGYREAARRHNGELRTMLARSGLSVTPGTTGIGYQGEIALARFEGDYSTNGRTLRTLSPSGSPHLRLLVLSQTFLEALTVRDSELCREALAWLPKSVPSVMKMLPLQGAFAKGYLAGQLVEAAELGLQLWDAEGSSPRFLFFWEWMLRISTVALAVGRVDEVVERVDRYAQLNDTGGPHPAPTVALHVHRAQILVAQGGDAPNEALHQAHAALVTAHEIGFASRRIDAIELIAVLLSRRDDVRLAARLLGAAQAERDRTGFRATLFDGWTQVVTELDALRLVPEFAEGEGMAIADAVELAQRSRGSRKRPLHGWDSLTPTELHVAQLAAAGRRNADIAETLYIGVATVKTHLSRIFAKTGCTNRSELAAVFPEELRP